MKERATRVCDCNVCLTNGGGLSVVVMSTGNPKVNPILQRDNVDCCVTGDGLVIARGTDKSRVSNVDAAHIAAIVRAGVALHGAKGRLLGETSPAKGLIASSGHSGSVPAAPPDTRPQFKNRFASLEDEARVLASAERTGHRLLSVVVEGETSEWRIVPITTLVPSPGTTQQPELPSLLAPEKNSVFLAVSVPRATQQRATTLT